MINLQDKKDCCGCSACVRICPKQCINFDEDEYGFRYPLVNESLCIDCGLCENVCPCINQSAHKKPQKVYSAINPNEDVRMQSSSGGIFTMLAESIIEEKGVVFGARFNENWDVLHDYTETKDGIKAFRGSKYVQSHIGDTYILVREFLKSGRKVLFTGTPCQISGLRLFLRKNYENLLTVEVACHGVPSPLIWQSYLKDKSSGKIIENVSFRDKTSGYRTYSTNYKIDGKIQKKYYKYDTYMLGFIYNLYLRPSCFNCPSKGGSSGCDILIADFWGVNSILEDNKGLSLVVINTPTGENYFNKLNCILELVNYDDAVKANPCLEHSTKESPAYQSFWTSYKKDGIITLKQFTKKYLPSFRFRIKQFIHRFI